MYINKSKKIVIKIGSSILVDKKGKPKKTWLNELVQDIKTLINKKLAEEYMEELLRKRSSVF